VNAEKRKPVFSDLEEHWLENYRCASAICDLLEHPSAAILGLAGLGLHLLRAPTASPDETGEHVKKPSARPPLRLVRNPDA
jgi:hypothetical protein